jgi:hypothetical protein
LRKPLFISSFPGKEGRNTLAADIFNPKARNQLKMTGRKHEEENSVNDSNRF